MQWLPSCQLLASRVCAPTLLSVGLAAVEATQAVVAATGATGAEAEAQQEAALLALHAATSEPGRWAHELRCCGEPGVALTG